MNNTITACIVAYNEERLIGRCLESIAGVVDEIIVVHDGECGDATLEISRQYTEKIFIRPHVGEAEPHRPFSFEQASSEWILQIDADEFLPAATREALADLVASGNADAFELLWPLWNGDRQVTKKWPFKRCLFRKAKARFLGLPHAVVEIDGRVVRIEKVLEHRPLYDNYRWSKFRSKWLPWARIQAGYYFKDFSEVNKFGFAAGSWPRRMQFRIRFPLWFLPLEWLVVTAKNLFSGAWREGVAGWKASFMIGAYRAAVDYYIFKIKHE